jgi:hypothetical protein
MARRVDRLITHIRSITENETANSTTDITDNEIIEYLNEAQHRIQARIVSQHPRVFIEETTIAAVADQEEYNLPSDVFLNNKILSVEYTTDSASSSPTYYTLKPAYQRDRNSHISGVPTKYIRRDKLTNATGSFLASPAPSGTNGQFRITYIRRIDELDKRRGIVSAVTLTSSAISALTLDISGEPPIDSTDLADHDFLTVVNDEGTIQMRNVKFSTINTGTGVVTVDGSFTFDSGETIAVGDYIVGGKDTSSHSSLPRNVERYLIEFAAWKIFKRDSSTDSAEQTQELLALEADIIESYQEIEEDVSTIAILEDWD